MIINVQIPIIKMMEEYIHENHLTVTQFAERCGLHTGTLSNLIHGNRPLSIRQLDLITKGMDKEEGILYRQYIDECVVNTPPNWRRIKPFFYRCAELGKLDCLKRAVLFITEHLMYLPMLFDAAEKLFASQFLDAAVILYENIAEGERFQHSERLALCHYRLFTLTLNEDQSSNLKKAHNFEIFVDRLDNADQLDAIKKLADVYISLDQWEQVHNLADLLEQKAKQCSMLSLNKQPERPILYYIHQAYLLKAAFYDMHREYEQALYYTSLYQNLTAGTPLNKYTEAEQKVIYQFQDWACANTYIYRLMSGDFRKLENYVDFVAFRPNEIPTALYMIIQAANLHQINIDAVLARFESHLKYSEQSSLFGKFNSQITEERYLSFQTELAKYFLLTERMELGLNYVLASLQRSVKIKSEHNILKCVKLFEQYREMASSAQCLDYSKWIKEVQN